MRSIALTLTSQLDIALTNGITLRQSGITSAAAAMLIFAYVSALAHASFWPLSRDRSAPEVRFATFVHTLVFVAYSGALSLDYPPPLRAFTENFGFVLGLLAWSPATASIARLTHASGGVNSSSTGPDVFYDLDETTRNETLFDTLLAASAQNPSVVPAFDAQSQGPSLGLAAYAEALDVPRAAIFLQCAPHCRSR